MLSVISYNIKFGKRLSEIASWLSSHPTKLDIMCFQEFPIKYLSVLFKAFPKDTYDYKYAPGFIKRGTEYGQLTVFNKTKMQCKSSKIATYPSSFFDRKIFRIKGERSSLITTFVVNNKQFRIANTHLDCLALNRKRRKQIKTIQETLSQMPNAKKMPTIILGDLNYTSLIGQNAFITFMEKYGFQNAIRGVRTHRLFLVPHQLDYVFYNNCSISDISVVKTNMSDHYPLFFTLVL